jgi:glycosyltransferase involved in cell wall biosynthesis
LDVARGDAVVVMDADLQDPPSVVLEMIALWEQGVDMVYGKRLTRDGETMMKKITAKLFYQLLRKMTSTPIPEDTGDFRLMDRKVVLQLRKMREQARFLRGMVSWIGFSTQPIHYHRQPRQKGTTKYPFFRMLRFAWEGITSFSAVPLRLATVAGSGFSMIAFAMAGYYILRQIIYQDFIKGWASVMVAIFLVGGLQLLFIGIVGEYLAKAFDELKDRPLYILSESSIAVEESDGVIPSSSTFPLEVVPESGRMRHNSR